MNDIERITISEAARRFNCSAVWLRRLCQQNRIASWKVTERLYLVDPNDVAAWFANAPQPGRPKTKKQNSSVKSKLSPARGAGSRKPKNETATDVERSD